MAKKSKQQYYQCNNCGNIEINARCRCLICDGAMLKYKDKIGIDVPQLINGKIYLK